MVNNDHKLLSQIAIEDNEAGLGLVALLSPALRQWKIMAVIAVAAGALGAGASYLVEPKFTAVNVFLPPQQQQSSAASALASLGALSGLTLGGAGARNSADEYIGLMQSATVNDRIIKKFGLMKLWDEKFQVDARNRLMKQVNIVAGKKDGLVHVEVTDADPVRAAQMANQYVEELRSLTMVLAVSEAQQRRVFFGHLLEESRDKLAVAQSALEASGFTAGALKSEPRNAAESYARTKAELTAAQVRLQVLRSGLADGSPEIQAQRETISALTSQITKMESQESPPAGQGDYVNRYREFKYQETLFDLFARQYETARVDESREGALIQVLDAATPPEKKSAPRRSMFGLMGAFLGLVIGGFFFVLRDRRRSEAPAHSIAR